MSITRRVLIDELIENNHFMDLPEIISTALSEYSENHKGMNSAVIASSISRRIYEAKIGENTTLVNPEEINHLLREI